MLQHKMCQLIKSVNVTVNMYNIMNSTMRNEETRFTFGVCSQFITGFVILISFFLLGSNDSPCPLAFLYLTRTDCIPCFIQFLSCLCQNKLNQLWGKQKVERAVTVGRGDLVSARTSSLHMNLLPGDFCPSSGQLPAGGRADV